MVSQHITFGLSIRRVTNSQPSCCFYEIDSLYSSRSSSASAVASAVAASPVAAHATVSAASVAAGSWENRCIMLLLFSFLIALLAVLCYLVLILMTGKRGEG
ncbi:uncharacterized protein LOC144119825 [Amblyomma americanum]